MAKQYSKSSDTLLQFNEIIANIKKGVYSPFYLLMGDEPYYSDVIVSLITAGALTEEEKDFNYHLFYGSEVGDRQVVEASMRFPMFAERQLVVVKEAQQMKLTGALESYFEHPSPTTVLLLVFTKKSMDKRLNAYKKAQKSGVVFESSPLQEDSVPSWIESYLSQKGAKIDQKAALLMAEFCGNDLRRIVLECDKLLTATSGSAAIEVKDVEDNIGISREYNTFELGSALLNRDMARLHKISNRFASNPKQFPLVVTLGTLFYFFSKLEKLHGVMLSSGIRDPYQAARQAGIYGAQVKDFANGVRSYSLNRTMRAIAMIRRFDAAAKSGKRGEATDGDLLREMLSRIVN